MSPRELFPAGVFGPPITEVKLTEVETELGVELPAQLRDFYRVCDGFREGRGNAKYLLSLEDEDSIGSLLSTTRFWWSEWPSLQCEPDFHDFVFFGFSGGDEVWGIDWRTGAIVIAYHHGMGSECEKLEGDIEQIWRADYEKYEIDA